MSRSTMRGMSELEARYGQELEHGENCTCCDYPLDRITKAVLARLPSQAQDKSSEAENP
jgi:hypothetical protein